jgi:hypothetical protein
MACKKLMSADIVIPIHEERLFERYPEGLIA